MRQYLHYPDDTIYIAGPACFYYGGYALWHALRGKAEFLGCILNDMQHLIPEGSLSYGAYGSKYGKYGYGSSQGHNE